MPSSVLAFCRPAGVNEEWLHVHGANTNLLVELYRRRLIRMRLHRVRTDCAELEAVRIAICADGVAALAHSLGRHSSRFKPHPSLPGNTGCFGLKFLLQPTEMQHPARSNPARYPTRIPADELDGHLLYARINRSKRIDLQKSFLRSSPIIALRPDVRRFLIKCLQARAQADRERTRGGQILGCAGRSVWEGWREASGMGCRVSSRLAVR
jgi:hypothetical protein